MKRTANKLKGSFYQHKGAHLVMLNDCEYIGGVEEFAEYILHRFAYMDNSMSIVYDRLAINQYKKTINESKTRKYAYMSLNVPQVQGVWTIHLELFTDIAPRTCANFLGLCNGFTRSDGEKLAYQGTEVNRIVKGMFI